MLARMLRRSHRRRVLPMYGVAAALVLGPVILFPWCGWPGILMVWTGGGGVIAYLGQYVHDAWRGRSLDPPLGTVHLADGRVTITCLGVSAEVALADIEHVTEVTSDGDDLKGLVDTLELQLRSGDRLRLPMSFEGCNHLRRMLDSRVRVTVLD